MDLFVLFPTQKKWRPFTASEYGVFTLKIKIVCVTAKQKKYLSKNLNPQIEKSKSGSFEQKQEITSDL